MLRTSGQSCWLGKTGIKWIGRANSLVNLSCLVLFEICMPITPSCWQRTCNGLQHGLLPIMSLLGRKEARLMLSSVLLWSYCLPAPQCDSSFGQNLLL
ncbi:hypothetical protein EV356DRAFT_14259 [Viridothelium virens]|uniref:Uncharacterized protein n=1 Tax=Viridothelium virens TaxID=1048519 RepID=A0A6A6HHP6_VIRVR|nr:hypothetical protein EV356DRAFT_14259 [Viridothelium virens]